MIYIANDWLKNESNEDEVRKILEEAFATDINPDYTEAIAKLEELGEDKIVNLLNQGYFAN